MSALLELLNAIRQSANTEWLTPAQRQCLDTLVKRARTHSPAVLIGPPGSGKTFLGCLLHQHVGFAYTADPKQLGTAQTRLAGIIIDNADVANVGARVLAGQAQLCGWTTALVLARSIDAQGVPTVRLPTPSQSDIQHCLGNLPIPVAGYGLIGEIDLWRAIRRQLSQAALEESYE